MAMRILRLFALSLAAPVLLAGPALAGWDEGIAAYNRGDFATALREFQPLAEQGNARAQYNLGAMYDNGTGVPQDYVEAAKWFRKTAEQGFGAGQYGLGTMYEHGQGGLPKDYAEAVKWYRKAGEQGFGAGQFSLGTMCALGLGVPKDYVEAHKWFNLAASRAEAGEVRSFAVESRKLVAEKMTSAQIAKAQKLAREWWERFQKRSAK